MGHVVFVDYKRHGGGAYERCGAFEARCWAENGDLSKTVTRARCSANFRFIHALDQTLKPND